MFHGPAQSQKQPIGIDLADSHTNPSKNTISAIFDTHFKKAFFLVQPGFAGLGKKYVQLIPQKAGSARVGPARCETISWVTISEENANIEADAVELLLKSGGKGMSGAWLRKSGEMRD